LMLTTRQRRMIRIASIALPQAVQGKLLGPAIPLFLAGPEFGPGRPTTDNRCLLTHIPTQTGTEIDPAASRFYPTGPAGGIQAFRDAIGFLSAGSGELALVGGVDTFLDLAVLARLSTENRLLADGVMDGFAPGEGAAFLLLATEACLRERNLEPLARVSSPALAEEPGHRYSEEPYRGEGLSLAVSESLASFGRPVESVFASFNGESLAGKEWSVAAIRNSTALAEPLQMLHPADCLGDAGAAMGPLMVGLASMGFQGGYIRDPSLVFCSSDGADRGAVCVSRAERPKS